jgi:hypothetical protein
VAVTSATIDDGAYGHLTAGTEVPPVWLPATTGERLDVVAAAPITVAFLYPATGVPGQPRPARAGIGYPRLSDHGLELVGALKLPTFAAQTGPPRMRRATLIIGHDRRIRQLIYPVPDPAGHADEVLRLL